MATVTVVSEPRYNIEVNDREFRLLLELTGQSTPSDIKRVLSLDEDDDSYNEVLMALYRGLADHR